MSVTLTQACTYLAHYQAEQQHWLDIERQGWAYARSDQHKAAPQEHRQAVARELRQVGVEVDVARMNLCTAQAVFAVQVGQHQAANDAHPLPLPEANDEERDRQMVLRLLADGALAERELLQTLGWPPQQVMRCLQRLVDAGTLVAHYRAGVNRYSIRGAK